MAAAGNAYITATLADIAQFHYGHGPNAAGATQLNILDPAERAAAARAAGPTPAALAHSWTGSESETFLAIANASFTAYRRRFTPAGARGPISNIVVPRGLERASSVFPGVKPLQVIFSHGLSFGAKLAQLKQFDAEATAEAQALAARVNPKGARVTAILEKRAKGRASRRSGKYGQRKGKDGQLYNKRSPHIKLGSPVVVSPGANIATALRRRAIAKEIPHSPQPSSNRA